jgi:hypothetical protein
MALTARPGSRGLLEEDLRPAFGRFADGSLLPLYAATSLAATRRPRVLAGRADAGTRTPDPFITSEVLYQLSYVGVGALGRRGGQG